jgi:hypothetical protein
MSAVGDPDLIAGTARRHRHALDQKLELIAKQLDRGAALGPTGLDAEVADACRTAAQRDGCDREDSKGHQADHCRFRDRRLQKSAARLERGLRQAWASSARAARNRPQNRPARRLRRRPGRSRALGGEPGGARVCGCHRQARSWRATTRVLFFLRRQVGGAEQRRRARHLPQQVNLLGALLAPAQMPREALLLAAIELTEHVQRRVACARTLSFRDGHTPVIGCSRSALQSPSAWRIGCTRPSGSVAIRHTGLSSADHGEWRSLVAHPAGGRAAAGSNPVSPM